MKTIRHVVIIASFLALLFGCQGPFSGGIALEITLDSGVTDSRLIAPNGLGDLIASYDIELSTISRTITGNRTVMTGLTAGTWNLTVVARDAQAVRLATGSALVPITQGAANTAVVKLMAAVPEDGETGTGNVQLTVRTPYGWADGVYVWINGSPLGEMLPYELMYYEDFYGQPWHQFELDEPMVAGSYLVRMDFFYYDTQLATDVFLPLPFIDSVLVYPGLTSSATVLYDPEASETGEFISVHVPSVPAGFSVLPVDYRAVPRRAYPILSWDLDYDLYDAPGGGYLLEYSTDEGETFYPLYSQDPVDPWEPGRTSYRDGDWYPDSNPTWYRLCAVSEFGISDWAIVIHPAIPENPYMYGMYGSELEGEFYVADGLNLYARDTLTGDIILVQANIAYGGSSGWFYFDIMSLGPVLYEALLPGREYEFTVSAFLGDHESDFENNSWHSISACGSGCY
jgi:hypothetical protein